MIENLFQLFFFFLIGYLSRKYKYFSEEASDYLIRFIIKIAFPALVIYNIYYLKLNLEVVSIILFGWFIIFFSILLSFLVGKLLKFDKKLHASFIMMSTFGNTGFLGIPFQKALLGEEAIKYGIIIDQLSSFIPVSLIAPFIIAFGSSSKMSFDIKKIILFPPFLSLILGFLISNFYVPKFVLISLKEIGMTVIPLALFSVGMNLKFSNLVKKIKEVFLSLFLKMLLIPFLSILILYIISDNLDIKWQATILEISMPPMVLASIFVMDAKLDKDLAVSAVGLGIIVSFLSVPFIVYIMRLI